MTIKHGSAEAAADETADERDGRLPGEDDQPTATMPAAETGEPETQADGNGSGAPPPGGGPAGAGVPPGPGGAPAQLVPVSAEQIAFALGQAQSQQKPKSRKGPAFWVPVSILAVLAGLGLLAGAFFVGRSTRDSPDVVAGKVSAAVTATNKAALIRGRNALDAQRTKMNRAFAKKLKRQQRLSYQKGRREGEAAGYASGQSAGYASGQSSGYSSGKADGTAEGQAQGYQEGFDQGTCYTPGTLDYVC